MQTPRHAFREYDIRGRAESDLSDDLVFAIGRALASCLKRSGAESLRVAVGRDCRLSSDRIFAALQSGLRASGADVIDIGVGPTPLLYFAAHHLGTDGAVMITGSHNPAPDNGFKMMKGLGSLHGAEVQQLRRTIEAEDFLSGEGGLTREDVSEAYLAALADSINLPAGTPPTVVVDAGNGAGGPLAVRSFQRLGIPIVPLHCVMDGRFPNHHPDPTLPENLVDLRQAVQTEGVGLGVAFDGDGDRIGVVDDQGDIIWGDRLMILFAREVLAKQPGAAIIGEVKCSQTLYDDIAKHGGRPIIGRTGHSLIKQRMKQEKALLAGEMSGHIFFADRYFGFDDAIYAAARLVELVMRQGKAPRQLLADVPKTSVTPEIRVPCDEATKFAVVQQVREHYSKSHEVLAVDGVRVSFGEGAWGLCRASNTSAVLVLRFEALDDAHRDAIRAEMEAVVAAARRELEGA
jgi:phosphomannomutase / phosphoglucomutase